MFYIMSSLEEGGDCHGLDEQLTKTGHLCYLFSSLGLFLLVKTWLQQHHGSKQEKGGQPLLRLPFQEGKYLIRLTLFNQNCVTWYHP